MGQTSASGIWRVIKNRYTSISRSSVVNLKRELNNIKKGNDSVTTFLQKIKEARDKLTSVGIHIDDEEILHIVLQGLPSDFHAFTSAMLTKNEPVLFEELHILMKTEEDLLKSSVDNTKEISHIAMAATANNRLGMEIGAEEIIEAEATEVAGSSHTIVEVFLNNTVELISPITTSIPQLPKIPKISKIPKPVPHAKSATNLDIRPLIAING